MSSWILGLNGWHCLPLELEWLTLLASILGLNGWRCLRLWPPKRRPSSVQTAHDSYNSTDRRGLWPDQMLVMSPPWDFTGQLGVRQEQVLLLKSTACPASWPRIWQRDLQTFHKHVGKQAPKGQVRNKFGERKGGTCKQVCPTHEHSRLPAAMQKPFSGAEKKRKRKIEIEDEWGRERERERPE